MPETLTNLVSKVGVGFFVCYVLFYLVKEPCVAGGKQGKGKTDVAILQAGKRKVRK